MTKAKTKKASDLRTTKEKILEAYLELCAEIGITHVTLEKVAKKSGVAFATVRYHFAQNGNGLEWEASIYVGQNGQKFTQVAIEEARKKPSFNGLKAYIDVTFEWIEKFPAQAKYLIYFYYVSGTRQDLPVRNDALVMTARLRTSALLHEAIGRKEIAPVKNADDLAVKIHTIVYGCGVLAMSIGTPAEYKLQRKIAWEMVESLIESAKTAKR